MRFPKITGPAWCVPPPPSFPWVATPHLPHSTRTRSSLLAHFRRLQQRVSPHRQLPPTLAKAVGSLSGGHQVPKWPPSVCAGAHSVAVGSHPQNPQHALTHTLTNHAGPLKDSAVTRKIHAARVSPLPPFLPPSLTSIPYFKVRHPHSRGHGRLCLIRPCRMYESSTPIPHPSTNSRARHRLRSWPS